MTWLVAMGIAYLHAMVKEANQHDVLYLQVLGLSQELQGLGNQLRDQQDRLNHLAEEKTTLEAILRDEQNRSKVIGEAFSTCPSFLSRIAIVGASKGRFDPEPQLILEDSHAFDISSPVIVVEASSLRELGLFQVVGRTPSAVNPSGLLARRTWADSLWWGDINQQAMGHRPRETTAVALVPPPGSQPSN